MVRPFTTSQSLFATLCVKYFYFACHEDKLGEEHRHAIPKSNVEDVAILSPVFISLSFLSYLSEC